MSLAIVGRSIWCNPGNRGKRLRKLLDGVIWQWHKRRRATARVLPLANKTLFKAYPDCVVSSALVYSDWPEYHELKFLRDNLRNGDIVLDVGANVGHISLLLSDMVGNRNIFCFEPSPVAFRRLQENWRLNGWPLDGLFQAAVGSQSGVVSFPSVSTPDTTLSLKSSPLNGDAIEVPLHRLDDHHELWANRTIGLLKIDVEGYEKEVFEGALKMLSEDRPRLVMFESLNSKLDADIASIFERSGYDCFQLDEQGRPDFSRLSAQNIFARPRE